LLIPMMLLSAWWALSWWPHLAGGAPSGDEAPPRVLIQAGEVKDLIEKKVPDLRIIDFRPLTKYYLGHIPGAIHLWLPETENQGQSLPGQPPPAKQLETVLGRLGIGSRDTLIIYSDQGDQTRLWWLLAYYGLPLNRMRLLDGGFEAWKAKNFPTQLTSPRFEPVSFRFPPKPGVSTLLATLKQAGYPLEKLHLYAGSWIEWSRSQEAANTGPAR
jgi:3-mercaptopyruvate sulfurtransferase SseA